MITVAYIKKRNLLCLMHGTELAFSSVAPIIKEKDVLLYRAVKSLRDRAFFYWQQVAGEARRDIERKLLQMGIPHHAAANAVTSFERNKDVEILKSVDTMRFPNQDIFKKRLWVLVKRHISHAAVESKKEELSHVDDDEERRTDDELLTILSTEKQPTPAELVAKKEETFDIEELIDRFEELGFWDEADYLRRFIDGRGRLSKYEVKKVKGAVRFLLFSMGIKRRV